MGWQDAVVQQMTIVEDFTYLAMERKARTGKEERGFDQVMTVAARTYFAPPFAVAPDIVGLLEEAARTVPSCNLRPNDLPGKAGFVYYERPILLPMVGEYAKHLDALDPRAPTDHVALRAWCWFDGNAADIFKDSLGIVFYADHWGFRGHLGYLLIVHHDYGADWASGGGTTDPDLLGYVDAANTLLAHVAAFFRFVKQKVLVAEPKHISDRQTRKRIARQGQIAPTEVPPVLIVQLRKRAERKSTDATGREVDWSCRWLVHGFWRQQWYPSQGRHVPIWIDDYVKGPPDKPLREYARTAHEVRR